MNDFLICDECGDVIGVYEPLVLVAGGHALETSQAARPAAAHAHGERYHRSCYTERAAGEESLVSVPGAAAR